jgi:hypothetical protein
MCDDRLVENDEEFSEIKKTYQGSIEELEQEGIQCSLIEIDDGIGASGPAIMGVISVGVGLFFGIPELHKRIGDAIKGWRKIYYVVNNAIQKIAGKSGKVYGYSVEYALLHVIKTLSEEVDVDSILIEAVVVIPGKGTITEGAVFETASLSQYYFIFRDNRDYAYCVSIDSELNMHSKTKTLLDPRHKE